MRLWRYLDIYKFYDMVSRKHIPLTKMGLFSDPLEGISLGLIIDMNGLKHSDGKHFGINDLLAINDKLPKEVQARISSYFEIQQTTYVSCWFHSDQESMAMWNLYSGKDGIALSVNAMNLIGKVQEHLGQVADPLIKAAYAGFVKYVDVLDFNIGIDVSRMKVNKVALRKHKSYEHEKEFRIVLRYGKSVSNVVGSVSEINFLSIPIVDFNSLDAKFYTHPEMPSWKQFCVARMSAQNNLDIQVLPSRIPLRGNK